MINKDKFSPLHGYYEGMENAVPDEMAQKAVSYKRDICKKFINICPEQIDTKLGGTEFFATRKIDGEMNVLFYENGEAVIINRSGRVRMGLACVEDAKAALEAAGIKQAVIPGELFLNESNGRTRISDVMKALADEKMTSSLELAFFDLLELDNQEFNADSYADTHKKLAELFKNAKKCAAIQCERTDSKAGVKDLYTRWAEEENAEGLVVRCDLPLVYKIKQRYTIDAAVIGYSEGTGDMQGGIRTLLLAMMTKDGYFQVIGKTGGGFSAELRVELLKKFEPMVIESQYIETDSNHTAYRMVRPEVVIELMINDVLFETASGPIYNALLELKGQTYTHRANIHGVSVIYPNFVRMRDDKKVVYEDIRLEQFSEFSFIESTDNHDAEQKKSKLLHRRVFKKASGTKLMVQKFMVWQTNKTRDFPAYVFNYTNFSSERKEALQREVCVSNDPEQIISIFEGSIGKNVKKGWDEV